LPRDEAGSRFAAAAKKKGEGKNGEGHITRRARHTGDKGSGSTSTKVRALLNCVAPLAVTALRPVLESDVDEDRCYQVRNIQKLFQQSTEIFIAGFFFSGARRAVSSAAPARS
jgi:hypothetical protein